MGDSQEGHPCLREIHGPTEVLLYGLQVSHLSDYLVVGLEDCVRGLLNENKNEAH